MSGKKNGGNLKAQQETAPMLTENWFRQYNLQLIAGYIVLIVLISSSAKYQ